MALGMAPMALGMALIASSGRALGCPSGRTGRRTGTRMGPRRSSSLHPRTSLSNLLHLSGTIATTPKAIIPMCNSAPAAGNRSPQRRRRVWCPAPRGARSRLWWSHTHRTAGAKAARRPRGGEATPSPADCGPLSGETSAVIVHKRLARVVPLCNRCVHATAGLGLFVPSCVPPLVALPGTQAPRGPCCVVDALPPCQTVAQTGGYCWRTPINNISIT